MSPNLMPDEPEGLPLHEWQNTKIEFESSTFPGTIKTVIALPHEYYDGNCAIHGCAMHERHRIKVLMKQDFGMTYLEFRAA